MTAKSRRRKFDKRKKSDEHAKPRYRKADFEAKVAGAREVKEGRILEVRLKEDGLGSIEVDKD